MEIRVINKNGIPYHAVISKKEADRVDVEQCFNFISFNSATNKGNV